MMLTSEKCHEQGVVSCSSYHSAMHSLFLFLFFACVGVVPGEGGGGGGGGGGMGWDGDKRHLRLIGCKNKLCVFFSANPRLLRTYLIVIDTFCTPYPINTYQYDIL